MNFSKKVSEITRDVMIKALIKEHYCWGCKEKVMAWLFSEISGFYGLCMKCFMNGKLKGKKIKFELK